LLDTNDSEVQQSFVAKCLNHANLPLKNDSTLFQTICHHLYPKQGVKFFQEAKNVVGESYHGDEDASTPITGSSDLPSAEHEGL
jgi:hypothetical protein